MFPVIHDRLAHSLYEAYVIVVGGVCDLVGGGGVDGVEKLISVYLLQFVGVSKLEYNRLFSCLSIKDVGVGNIPFMVLLGWRR